MESETIDELEECAALQPPTSRVPERWWPTDVVCSTVVDVDLFHDSASPSEKNILEILDAKVSEKVEAAMAQIRMNTFRMVEVSEARLTRLLDQVAAPHLGAIPEAVKHNEIHVELDEADREGAFGNGVDSPGEMPSRQQIGRFAQDASTGFKPQAAVSSILQNTAQEEEVEIQESVWDSFLFVGFGELPWEDICVSLCVTLVNTALQVIFCLVVYANMTSPDIDSTTVSDARHWRGAYAHDYAFADHHQSQLSLASLVCTGYSGMIFSSSQVEINERISDYLSPEGEMWKRLNGQVMCVIAVLIWCCSSLDDACANLRILSAVFHQPFGKPSLGICENDRYQIESLGKLQILRFVLVISLPRLCITMALCWVGILYIVYTTDMENLLLNTMALHFIVEIDELVYKWFASFRVKHLVSNTCSLRTPAWKFGSLDKLAKGIVAAVVVIFMWFVYLDPFVTDMQQVQWYLCGGKLNFVTATNPSSLELFQHETVRYDQASFRDLPRFQETLGLAGLGGGNFSATPLPHMSAIGLISLASTEDGSNMLKCIDHLNRTAVEHAYGSDLRYWGMLAVIRQQVPNTGSNTTMSCIDIAHMCYGSLAIHTRAICPRTCGCGSVLSGNPFATPKFGCPGMCASLYDASILNMDYALECRDVPATVLSVTNAWQFYVDGVSKLYATLFSISQAAHVKMNLASFGCDALRELHTWGIDLCLPNLGGIGRSVRPFCPHTCKKLVPTICTVVDVEECPSSCWNFSFPVFGNVEGGQVRYDYKPVVFQSYHSINNVTLQNAPV